MRSQVFSLLVDNNPGVLSRIAGLFSRRGYSIDSITAGATTDTRFTRITVVASGDELILSQIEKQVRKLEDVVDIKSFERRRVSIPRTDHGKTAGKRIPKGRDYFSGRYFQSEDS